ncbi:hypothetical protein DSLASN_24400 [Desulfoluna limicola]|uniref:Response regulatory domain-containing protein n=1 Tax=Desulfoluna limicola TaxID=2810562 RepID=A0ABM7PIB8_9BACT|nr:SpoIIE family protein phosphatase [Desulfoluna limicola]BCS96808.1 hypothetical protein DSLASN_24400 [Desulfoluna limicola]
MKTAGDVTILFVDDEPDLLRSLGRFLRKEPYRLLFAGGGAKALELLSAEPVDIVISDLRMPDMDGLALLRDVKAGYPKVIRIILSATRDVEQTIEAINTGEVYRFISKPLDPELFKQIIRDTVDYHLLKCERREVIAEIEKRLLHASPPKELAGASISALMIPAGNLGGDFADYFVYDNRQLDILIGDVMGKGIQSALVAASLKHLFAKALALHDCSVTPKLTCRYYTHDINKIDQVLLGVEAMCLESLMELEIFATLNYARLDLEAGKIGLVDCGHPPVIHYRAETRDCTTIKGNNMPLGIMKQSDYHVVTQEIKVGDLLLFYSDGITETQDKTGELFGEERLTALVQVHHHLPIQELLNTIRAAAETFCGCEQFRDDFTCIGVRIET